MRPYYIFCRFLCQWLSILVVKMRVFDHGRVPRTGGVILACNHQSFFDPVLATLALPRECSHMARDTLFQNRWFRKLIESLNAFPIRRGEADLSAIKEALRRLRNGHALSMFPEGTRTKDGHIQPLMPGMGSIAKKAKVPVFPVLIEGAYDAWPRDRKLPCRSQVTVCYGEPITPEQMTTMTAEQILEVIATRLRALQDQERRRRGLEPLEYSDSPGMFAPVLAAP